MIRVRAAGGTDTGRVRPANQDSYVVDDDQGLYAVCDGVGGHRGGEVASALAVETLSSSLAEPTVEGLVQAARWANRAVWKRAEEESELRGMATTLSAVALVAADEDGEDELACINVGDSRVYLLRDGELSQLTDDHSLVEELVREGRLTPEEARAHPHKHQITRALGLDPDVEVDNWRIVPFRGDRFLLCSDGLTNEVTDDAIASVLRRFASPDEAVAELIRQANEGGGADNITAVIVDVVEDDDRAERAAATVPAPPVEAREVEVESGPDTTQAVSVPPPATVAPDPEPEADIPVPRRREARPRRRLLTFRSIIFVLLVIGVLVAAIGAVAWYARGTYYVAFDEENEVAVYQGRPGGLLWFEPTLEKRMGLNRVGVPPARVAAVEDGHEVPSPAAAERYVENLRQEFARTQTTTTTTTTSTTPGLPSP